MVENIKKQSTISYKDELGRLFIISFGVFLFILFFQPFPLERLDYNSRLLYVTGFGVMIFIIAGFMYMVLPHIFPKLFKLGEWESDPPYLLSLFFLVMSFTAFAFYIRYVGKSQLTLYIMFKAFLVCLLPLIILIIMYKNKSLERINKVLIEQSKLYFLKIADQEKQFHNEEIILYSENKTDHLKLKHKNLIAIKSADNYIEIYYLENSTVEKKLIRNTLKNIETQLSNQGNFIRCHRTSIVNMIHVDKLSRNYSGYSLIMNHYEDRIPVARQYLLQIKDAISISK